MAALLFYLSRSSEAYDCVTAEVRSQFSSVSEIRSGPRLAACAYLRACIDETLRITPSAGSALWREVLPGGAMLDGRFVPGGCDVGVGIYALHHNPEYYPEPGRFMPERWLTAKSDGVDKMCSVKVRLPYSPFSAGPRGCLGKSLALMELMLTMATVLFVFDFQSVDGAQGGPEEDNGGSDSRVKGAEDEYQTWDHITAAKKGPILSFYRRI